MFILFYLFFIAHRRHFSPHRETFRICTAKKKVRAVHNNYYINSTEFRTGCNNLLTSLAVKALPLCHAHWHRNTFGFAHPKKKEYPPETSACLLRTISSMRCLVANQEMQEFPRLHHVQLVKSPTSRLSFLLVCWWIRVV